MVAEVSHAELQAETCDRDLSGYARTHADLEHRVRLLEGELEELRRARIQAYALWWNTREDRDRSLHVARRLRRRIDRVRRRLHPYRGFA